MGSEYEADVLARELERAVAQTDQASAQPLGAGEERIGSEVLVPIQLVCEKAPFGDIRHETGSV